MNLFNQHLFQVLIIVDVEAVGIVKDVSDEKPTEKCHLDRNLRRSKKDVRCVFENSFQTVTIGNACTSAHSIVPPSSFMCFVSWAMPMLMITHTYKARCSV